MKKNILIVRASTLQQEVDSQKEELTAYAERCGATNIKPIGNEGASAIKLDEEYQRIMEDVYKEIESGEVESIYAWSIDRIGRNEEILMKFKNDLIRRKIQLRILNPTLQLLNEDGTVNSGAELAFALFATMSRQEMETKKERFRRGRKKKKSEGKYIGGGVAWGYKAVDKRLVVDEERAEKIRFIFEQYGTTEESMTGVARLCMEKWGLWDNESQGRHTIQSMINKPCYKGDNCHPQLIDEWLWNQCQYKRLHAKGVPRKRDRYIMYCHGIVYATLDGREYERMKILRSNNVYTTHGNAISVNLYTLDGILVEQLQRAIDETDFDEVEKMKTERKGEIDKLLEDLQAKRAKLAEKRKRLEVDYYVRGKIVNGEVLLEMVDRQMKDISDEEARLRTELTRLEALKDEKPDLYSLTSDDLKRTIRKYVRAIIVYKGNVKRKEDNLRIDINFQNLSLNATSIYLNRIKKEWFYTTHPFHWHPVKLLPKVVDLTLPARFYPEE